MKGGPWTWVDPSNEENKSVLDLAIVSAELEQYVETLHIDSKRTMTAFKVKEGKLSYPDHYSILLNFKGIPKKKVTLPGKKSHIRWNTNKKDGWNQYKKLTSENDKLDEIANSDLNDPDEIMEKFEKELNKTKFRAFGKVKAQRRENKDLENLTKQKKTLIEGNSYEDEEFHSN